LGLALLPLLADGDLYAEGENLARLKAEAELLLDNLDVVAEETGTHRNYVELRIRNILNAIDRAQLVSNGGVVIW
jgi:hypothetical protein